MPKPAQLLLQHQRLSDRERVLGDNIERIESALASDPEVVQLEEKLEAARAAQQAGQLSPCRRAKHDGQRATDGKLSGMGERCRCELAQELC
jgi:hypothetical protein